MGYPLKDTHYKLSSRMQYDVCSVIRSHPYLILEPHLQARFKSLDYLCHRSQSQNPEDSAASSKAVSCSIMNPQLI